MHENSTSLMRYLLFALDSLFINNKIDKKKIYIFLELNTFILICVSFDQQLRFIHFFIFIFTFIFPKIYEIVYYDALVVSLLVYYLLIFLVSIVC